MAGVSHVGDLTGKLFGRWRVIELAPSLRKGRRWMCRCECGTERIVAQRGLKTGSRSCGCLSREIHSAVMARMNSTHGFSKMPEYQIWKGIVRRCLSPRRAEFQNYGGRGITICNEWRASFPAFIEHIGRRPGKQFSVDRIDNNGNYEPGNVRWADRPTQRRNSRAVRLITVGSETKPLWEWLEGSGVTRSRFKSRIHSGWEEGTAATRPVAR